MLLCHLFLTLKGNIINIVNPIIGSGKASSSIVSVGIESAWRLGNWDRVARFLEANKRPNLESLLGQALLYLKEGKLDSVAATTNEILQLSVGSIVASGLDSYESSYKSCVYLHIAEDVMTFVNIYETLRKEGLGQEFISQSFKTLEQRYMLTRPMIKN